jgi:uncharacterized protein YycO
LAGDNKQGEQQRVKKQQPPIIITECPTEPCAIYYTDTFSQSILIICRSQKHATNADIQKEVEEWIRSPARPSPNQEAQPEDKKDCDVT